MILFIVSILSVYAFYKTIGYAIFEYKDNSNKVGGIICAILAFIALISPITVTIIR